MKKYLGIICLVSLFSLSLQGARLKDLASLNGVRDNQLVGYGLVVGLSGTGDKDSDLTQSSLQLVLRSLDVDLKPETMETKNVAAVVVSANLKPFMKIGSRLDVSLASIGSASSLEGGTLMMTPLKGADGNVYAMAQGKVPAKVQGGGGGAAGGGGDGVSAKIPGSALLERAVEFDISQMKSIRYLIHSPDFTTAARVARQINIALGAKYASAMDAGTVEVAFPMGFEGDLVELVAKLENIDIEADGRAKVVINKRTGTVILGNHVTIAPVVIAHNNLRIEVEKKPPASQQRDLASQLSQGATAEDDPDLKPRKKKVEKEEHVLMMAGGANVADVVSSLNALGATPQDLIAILQSLKASGALIADLEVE